MYKNLLLSVFLIFSTLSCKENKKEVEVPKLTTVVKSPEKTLESISILKRKPKAKKVWARTIMIVFSKLSPRFSTTDNKNLPNSKRRSEVDAIKIVKKILKVIKDGKTGFEKLQVKYSDDPFSGPNADYIIVEDDGISTKLKNLILRMDMGETAVVKNDKEYVIVQRISEPPEVKSPDTAGIMSRKVHDGNIKFKFITVGYRDLRQKYTGYLSKKANSRSRLKAAELILSLKKRVDNGEDFEELFKEFSERIPQEEKYHSHAPTLGMKHDHDHSHGKKHEGGKHVRDARPAKTVNPVEAKKRNELKKIRLAALRLELKETAIVTTEWGYHLIIRIN
ncbi:MAG: peptidylprolyl isomerase [Deltaproteobacteria bacterium]|nr:peptidylprolyl isomerase [Deltaproteobacteria bacterium]